MNHPKSRTISRCLLHPLTTWVALIVAGTAPRPVAAAPAVGKPAPSFALRDGEGALFRLEDLAYTGRDQAHRPKHPLVIDFFRTDCAPCKRTLPKLVALHKRFKDKGLKVVLVALLEEDEGRDKLDAFLRKNPLPFTVLIDAYGVAGKKYVLKGNGFSIPATFVIDKTGVLRLALGGIDEKAWGKLQAELAKLL